MKNKIIFGFALAALSATIGFSALALTPLVDEQTKLDSWRTLGLNMIENRLSVLSTADTLLSQAALVSDRVKADLSTEIQNNEASLSALKDEISAETALDAMKQKVASIVEQYRIYIVVLPKTYGFATASRFRSLEAKVDVLADKIEEESVDDSSEAKSLIEQARNLLVLAEQKIDLAEQKYSAMSVENYLQAAALNFEARAYLIEVKGYLHDALAKVKQAVDILKSGE
ncbi:MAG: hypothetical protein PHW53_02705 [Patescibacteria group bacterium]|nr:hypothetical protein [Patescibacteria group bacterium]